MVVKLLFLPLFRVRHFGGVGCLCIIHMYIHHILCPRRDEVASGLSHDRALRVPSAREGSNNSVPRIRHSSGLCDRKLVQAERARYQRSRLRPCVKPNAVYERQAWSRVRSWCIETNPFLLVPLSHHRVQLNLVDVVAVGETCAETPSPEGR